MFSLFGPFRAGRWLASWRGAAFVEGAVILFLILFIRAQRADLAAYALAVKNPEVKTETKIVYVTGPERIRTITVKEPGRETVERVEERGPQTVTIGEDRTSRPVPMAEILRPHRSDRWLAGVQVDDGRFRDWRGYTALGGYSFRNRVDLLGGWGNDGWKLQAVGRF